MILLKPIYFSLLIFKSVLRPWLRKEVRPLFSPQTGELCTITSCSSLPTTLKTDTGFPISLYQGQTKYFHLMNFVLIYSKLSLKSKRKNYGAVFKFLVSKENQKKVSSLLPSLPPKCPHHMFLEEREEVTKDKHSLVLSEKELEINPVPLVSKGKKFISSMIIRGK